MFIWRLWGDVWQVGDGGDFLSHIIVNIIIFCFMVALTLIVLVPVLAFMGIRAIFFSGAATTVTATGPSLDARNIASLAVPAPCRYCGNTKSLDIRPCIRCGK